MIDRLFIDEAKHCATKSNIKIAHHGAVVIYRGKIVGKGYNYAKNLYNNNKENSRELIKNNKYKYSVHAEVAAIKNSLKNVNQETLKKCELIVVRVNNMGELMNSQPCDCCKNFINNFKIRKTYYS